MGFKMAVAGGITVEQLAFFQGITGVDPHHRSGSPPGCRSICSREADAFPNDPPVAGALITSF